VLPLSNLYNKLYDKEDSIKVVLKNGKELNLSQVKNFKDVKLFRAKRSSRLIILPLDITKDLSYFIGVVVGDGYVKAIKRKKGGYYWEIVINGKKDYIDYLANLVNKIFGISPKISKEKRRRNVYILDIHSLIVFRYLTGVFGFRHGKKSGNIPQINFVENNSDIFKNYLAGLIDTDGYINRNYVALVQKDRRFLERIKDETSKLLGFKFSGPLVNRRINDEVVGWWLISTKVNEFINTVPLRYRYMPP